MAHVLFMIFMLGLSSQLFSQGVSANERGWMEEGASTMNWRDVSNEYVFHEKGWDSSDFELQLLNETEELFIVKVANKDDRRSIIPGGGKSFQIYIDKKTKSVVREIGYQ